MLDWLEVAARLGAAAVIGGAIGVNRHVHHKSTGLRTLSLLAAGSGGLVMAVLHVAGDHPHVDATSRVIQGIMTGLGFIGAGVILRGQSSDKVHGLTTAAAVWTTAVLGALCGLGAWRIVITLVAIVAVILLAGGAMETWVDHKLDGRHDRE
jgi:putative Mg2+ transporter-C (MgtC) family protein